MYSGYVQSSYRVRLSRKNDQIDVLKTTGATQLINKNSIEDVNKLKKIKLAHQAQSAFSLSVVKA